MKDGNARGSMELALLYRLITTPNPTDWAKARPEGTSPSSVYYLKKSELLLGYCTYPAHALVLF